MVHPFGRPQSTLSLSRLLPSFLSEAEQQPQRGFISAVVAGELARGAAGRNVWALVDLRIQQWDMSVEGWEKLLMEEDISDQTRAAVREHFPNAPQSDVELDLELLDLKLQGYVQLSGFLLDNIDFILFYFDRSDDMVMLVSWAGQDEEAATEFATNPRRVYAIVYLRHLPGAFTITKVQAVPYQSVRYRDPSKYVLRSLRALQTSSSGAPMHPRLQVVVPEKLIAIQFGDTVTICAQGKSYRNIVIELAHGQNIQRTSIWTAWS